MHVTGVRLIPTIEPFKGVDMSRLRIQARHALALVTLRLSSRWQRIQARLENRLLELPEIASQEILGEWLIPKANAFW